MFHQFAAALCALACITTVSFADEVRTESGGVTTALAETAHASQLLGKLCEARLANERFNLRQIKHLREQGHATWLETARQQALVDSLVHKHEALLQFKDFVQRVDEQYRAIPPAGLAEFDRDAIVKIYLPDSVQMIGFLSLTPGERTRLFTEPHDQTADPDLAQAIEMAKQRMKRAETLFANAARTDSPDDTWARQSSLQYGLASAEWRWLQLKRQMTNHKQVNQVSRDTLADLISPYPDMISGHPHQISKKLWLASSRVAAAEAKSAGRLRAAEIRIRQKQLRYDGLLELAAAGLVTQSRLNRAAEELQECRTAVQHQQERRRSLNKISEARTGFQADHSIDSHRRLEAVAPKTIRELPDAVFADGHQLLHLVELRQQFYELRGRRESNLALREMKQEYLQRLRTALHSNGQPQTDSLEIGERRQLQSLELEIEYLQAIEQYCQEQMAVLALEEHRFVLQCVEQVPFVCISPVSTRSADGVDALSPGWMSAVIPSGRDHYVVSTGSLIASDFSLVQRSGPLLMDNGYRGPTPSIKASTHFARKRIPTIADPSDPVETNNRTPYSDPPSYRFGTYSWRTVYPYGALRSDLRKELPAGYTPWYRPGWPTNIQ